MFDVVNFRPGAFLIYTLGGVVKLFQVATQTLSLEVTQNNCCCLISDPPKILSVDKDRVKTATLFASANFECVGEGNPLPTYQWLQTLPTPSNGVLERGREAKLLIPNVTYDFQGEYRCKVTNVINGKERSELSYPIILQVVGKQKYPLYLKINNKILDKKSHLSSLC